MSTGWDKSEEDALEKPPDRLSLTTQLPLSRARKAAKIVLGFALGQGALQGLQLFIMLFLVRELSVEAYAQFGLAYGFQATVGSLMDFGISAAIIPLIGERRDDPVVVGQYIRAAKRTRNLTFWIVAPFAVVGFLVLPIGIIGL